MAFNKLSINQSINQSIMQSKIISLSSYETGVLRVGHLILRALAIWASNPQNALASIIFTRLENCAPRPPHHHPLPHRDHAVATAGKLAISPKTSLSCSSFSPLNHTFRFFSFFPPFNDFQDSKIYFNILARNHFTFSIYQSNMH